MGAGLQDTAAPPGSVPSVPTPTPPPPPSSSIASPAPLSAPAQPLRRGPLSPPSPVAAAPPPLPLPRHPPPLPSGAARLPSTAPARPPSPPVLVAQPSAGDGNYLRGASGHAGPADGRAASGAPTEPLGPGTGATASAGEEGAGSGDDDGEPVVLETLPGDEAATAAALAQRGLQWV